MSDLNEGWEYAVMEPAYSATDPHRGPMSNSEASVWVEEWEKEGGRKGMFVKYRRPVGTWEATSD